MGYILREGGPAVLRQIETLYPKYASLFELAIKSNLPLIIYVPGDELTASLIEGIEEAGKDSGIPSRLWVPLVTDMKRGVSYSDIKTRVLNLHESIQNWLGSSKK